MSNTQAQPALASEPIGRLQKDSFRLRRDVVRPMLSLGMTSFLSQISIVCTMAAVLNMCRRYGAQDPIYGQPEYAQIPTAVIGIVMKFFQIVISVAVGLAAGTIKRRPHNFSVAFRQKLLYNAVKSFGRLRRHAEQGEIV